MAQDVRQLSDFELERRCSDWNEKDRPLGFYAHNCPGHYEQGARIAEMVRRTDLKRKEAEALGQDY